MRFKIWTIVTLVFAIIMGGSGVQSASSISRDWISPIGEEFGAPITPIPINITEQQQKLKEQNWEIFYSPEYRFSLDYPNYNGKTNITERISTEENTIISFRTPSILFSVIVDNNNIDSIDPQELAVSSSQDLDEGEGLAAGGVTRLIQDGVVGYMYTSMPQL
jgi:hypothetical protein